MEAKKTSRSDLENKRFIFREIGFIVALATVFFAFETKYYQEEAKEMMDTQEVIILDVREQDEYDSGHIPGAVLLPVGSIP